MYNFLSVEVSKTGNVPVFRRGNLFPYALMNCFYEIQHIGFEYNLKKTNGKIFIKHLYYCVLLEAFSSIVKVRVNLSLFLISVNLHNGNFLITLFVLTLFCSISTISIVIFIVYKMIYTKIYTKIGIKMKRSPEERHK
jgi:hypothetical protein